MAHFPHVEAAILVGGKSSRMGRDKASLEINGTPILRRTADVLVPLVTRVALVGSPEQYKNFGLPALSDQWPSEGPLGGIATALASARAQWCLILACDLPYLTEDWLIFLLDRTVTSEADIIIPENTSGLEPLCAVYRTASAPTLAGALGRGVRKVTDAFTQLNVERISEREWMKFSPDGTLFHNMNTWQDYLDARQHLES
jgi:molybdopterin-guanine dinucleotide biosynthesis protein A